ncbi:MAG: hypothetical protein AB8B51_02640 [Sedimentitalea sp.]
MWLMFKRSGGVHLLPNAAAFFSQKSHNRPTGAAWRQNQTSNLPHKIKHDRGKMSKYLLLPALALLSACAEPAVTQFNGHSVNIRTSNTLPEQMRVAQAEANAVCAKAGKRAEFASTTYVLDLNMSNFYLCVSHRPKGTRQNIACGPAGPLR